MTRERLRERYFSVVRDYLVDHDETHLLAAQDLGREFVLNDLPPEELGALHEEALCVLATQFEDGRVATSDQWASAVHTEVLMAYGLAFREYVAQLEARERALREAHDDLERRVIERTQELTREVRERKLAQDAVLQSKQDVEVASRAKSQFLASMSHELRTPLNAILGFSEVMVSDDYGPRGTETFKEYAGLIHGSGEHLLELINDVLDVSKVEAGQLELHEEEIPVDKLMEACLRMVGDRAERGQLQLSPTVTGDLPCLWADERRAKQVLLNLLSNAVKFTPNGGAINTSAHLGDDGSLVITVSDTGIGMSPQELDIALRPFGQVDSSLARKFEGTGLGLHLAQELMKLHGGSLNIESEKGAGTTATMQFPADRVIHG